MDRSTRKIENSPFRAMAFKLASMTERDEYLHTFPHPIPVGHSLKYRWVDDMTVELAVVPDVPVKPETVAAVDDLNQLSLVELKTRAAEMGITVDPKWSKRQVAGAIQEKQAVTAA